jgi:hypothetical protein
MFIHLNITFLNINDYNYTSDYIFILFSDYSLLRFITFFIIISLFSLIIFSLIGFYTIFSILSTKINQIIFSIHSFILINSSTINDLHIITIILMPWFSSLILLTVWNIFIGFFVLIISCLNTFFIIINSILEASCFLSTLKKLVFITQKIVILFSFKCVWFTALFIQLIV